MNYIRQIIIGAACLMSMAASAQWQWTDKDGRKVFSDRPPPADVLEKNILKRPVTRATVAGKTDAPGPVVGAADAIATAASAPPAAASVPKLSGVDKELADKKKKAEEAEAGKRKAEGDRIAKAKVENCARAKQAKAGFDSGRRMARTNEKGEQEILDSAARAAEVKRIQSIIDSDCI